MTEPIAESVVTRPAQALRPFVERYIGYRYEGFPPGVHRGLPSRHLTLIITLDGTVDLAATPDGMQARSSFHALVGGLHARPATIVHDGRQHGVQLELTPRGARALLGLPAAALASQVVPLDRVLGRHAHRLAERLAAAATWRQRFAVLDDALRSLVRDRSQPAPAVMQAWRLLAASGGTMEVSTVAGEVGWSRRHLAERFRAEFGLSPKLAARVLRFERAHHLLRQRDHSGLADVAALCGYYDQAHLTREWRELAGCTPSVWLAEELPFIQDTGLVDAGA